MASSDLLEEKKDYTEEVKVKIPEATALAQDGKLAQALELLMGVERNCRVGLDWVNLKEVVLTLIRLCRKCEDWDQLNTTLTLISKRRGQHSPTITAMIQEAVPWLEEAPTKERKISLLVTLRSITDGKIFVEKERAQLTRVLAKIKEDDGDIEGAAEVLQEVAAETYGALDKKEKADFILEQVRLTLAKKDYVRAMIQSRKINRKVMMDDDMQELKIRFYGLMVEYDMHEKAPFDLCKDFHSIYETPMIQSDADVEKWKDALKSCVLFLVLSPYDNHQQDMLHRVAKYEKLVELPEYKELLRLFTTPEIIGYPLQSQAEFEGHPALALGGQELKEKWIKDLHTRVVQHNIRVISKYYQRIRSDRLAELLGLELPDTERFVSEMVSDGSLYAKINRPAGTVNFAKPKPPEEIMSAWNSDIASLLGLVERTCHLINKETMLHKAA